MGSIHIRFLRYYVSYFIGIQYTISLIGTKVMLFNKSPNFQACFGLGPIMSDDQKATFDTNDTFCHTTNYIYKSIFEFEFKNIIQIPIHNHF